MDNDRIAYRITEAADLLGISRSKAYEGVASGDIPTIKIAGVRRVSAAGLRAIIERQQAESELVGR